MNDPFRKYIQRPLCFILTFYFLSFVLKTYALSADDLLSKRVREEGGVACLTVHHDDITVQKDSLHHTMSSIWKESLNFSYTPYSPFIDVDSWHHANAHLIKSLQKELAKESRTPNTNVAIAGIQCIYNSKEGDDFGITKIINIPKVFVSGYRSCRLPRGFSDFIDMALTSFPSRDIAFIKEIYDGLYGIGDGYIYSGFDQDYPHSRAYMAQNFRLWLGERSNLSKTHLCSKLHIIEKDGVYKGQFAENYFHSEQAVLAFLESELGMDFLFQQIFKKIVVHEENPQITQLVLHVSSYYDVCNTCADTLFRESEVGRMFLEKLEGRLKACHYLYPQNKISLMVETSGILEYRKGGVTTRPAHFELTPLFRMPLVSVQAPPYVMRMKIGERK